MRFIIFFFTFLCAAIAAPSLKSHPTNDSEVTENRYIIKLKTDVSTGIADVLKSSLLNTPTNVFSMTGFQGFAGVLSPEELARLQASDHIEYVEEDAMVYTTAMAKQDNVPWGLARLSSRERGNTSYVYDENAGEGTCVYIVDTGIDVNHPEFEGRATFLADFTGTNKIDEQGHGTFVAGIVGSKTYGVAKKTQLYAVKVLSNRLSTRSSAVLDGIMYLGNKRTQYCPRGSVVNISIGVLPRIRSIDDAVKALVHHGLFVAVAAGNDGLVTSSTSPQSEPSVCLVGATDENDMVAPWSNYGPGIDIFAPGANIESTELHGSTNIASGTSASSPFVAGLGALATSGTLKGVRKHTVNLLAYNGNDLLT